MRPQIWIINQYSSLPRFGFAGRHYHLAKNLEENGMDVTLFLGSVNYQTKTRNRRLFGREPLSENLSAFWIPILHSQKSYGIFRVLNWLIFAFLLIPSALWLRGRPQTIFYSSLGLPAVIPAFILAKIFKAQFIFEVRDIWPLSLNEFGKISKYNLIYKVLLLIEKWALRNADLIVSPIPGLQEYLDEHKIDTPFTWLPQSGEIDHLPMPPATHKQRQIKMTVAYAGTLNLSNDVLSLLEAAKNLKQDKTIRFLIIGGGPLYQELCNQKAIEGLDNLVIMGATRQEELPTYLKDADILYHGAHNRPLYRFGICPIKIGEYLCYHRPILQSYSGGYDVIKAYECGRTVASQDATALSRAIKELQALDDEAFSLYCRNAQIASDTVFNHKQTASVLCKKLRTGHC